MIPQGFTEDEAAALLHGALQVMGTLEAACIDAKPWSAPLPAGLLSCGEAITLIPAVVVLVSEMYPRLTNPEYFSEAVTFAQLQETEGEA